MADHRFGPSRTLRNFLGSITSSLSSLPSNPFRWHLPSSLPLLPPLPSSSSPPPPIPPSSPPRHSPPPPLATSSPLYPSLEMEESRKRMRFAAQDDVHVAAPPSSNKKHKHAAAADNLGETTAVDDVHMASVESNCTTSATPNAPSLIRQIPGKTPPLMEPLLTPKAENFDETLVGYVERISAVKRRASKRGQDKGVRDVVRNKRIKASKSDAGTNAVSGLKRKEPDDSFAGLKYEKRLRKLTISEGWAQKNDHDMDGKQDLEQSVAAASHADDKLRRSISVHNLPQNAKRSDISKLFSRYGAIESVSMEAATASYKPLIRRRNHSRNEIDKTKNSQTASVVFKDEQSAIAALTLNVKGFNGSYIFVTAACSSTQVSEDFSGLPYDLAHAAIISNLPSDIKDEDLLKILHGYSSNIRIEALRVLRNARPELGASAYVVFRSLSNVYTVQLKSKDDTIQVSQVSTSSKRTQKEPVAHTMKRRRDPKADDGSIQKKGTTNKDIRAKQYQLPTSKNDNESELTKNTTPDSLSGRKQKREEKHQRGISRSKKIRRT